MEIKIPARFTQLKKSEISEQDYKDMELLRHMNWIEIKSKCSYEELLYFEQLFELIDEMSPYAMYEAIYIYERDKKNIKQQRLNPYLA